MSIDRHTPIPDGRSRAPEPITGFSSMATRHILAELAQTFERITGRRVSIRSMGGVTVAERVRAGEAVDIVVLASEAMERLEAEGHVRRGSLMPFASSGIAAAVPSGAARPHIGDADALRRATLAASRLCYSTGPSGTHLRRLWEGWGIDTTDPGKVLLAPPGVPVGELLAGGAADLGFQQRSELIGVSGIDVLGDLPAGVQLTTTFTIGIGGGVEDVSAVEEFLEFLTSSEHEKIRIKHGMRRPE